MMMSTAQDSLPSMPMSTSTPSSTSMPAAPQSISGDDGSVNNGNASSRRRQKRPLTRRRWLMARSIALLSTMSLAASLAAVQMQPCDAFSPDSTNLRNLGSSSSAKLGKIEAADVRRRGRRGRRPAPDNQTSGATGLGVSVILDSPTKSDAPADLLQTRPRTRSLPAQQPLSIVERTRHSAKEQRMRQSIANNIFHQDLTTLPNADKVRVKRKQKAAMPSRSSLTALTAPSAATIVTPIPPIRRKQQATIVRPKGIVTNAHSNGNRNGNRLATKTTARTTSTTASATATATTNPTIKTNKKSTALLTKEEERQLSEQIRALLYVTKIRDELTSMMQTDDLPDQVLANACDLTVSQLRRTQHEGQEARSQLVSANAGLVRSLALRYHGGLQRALQAGGGVGTILSLQDMIQEGNLGLMRAAEKFEPERGLRFSTYATYWIRQKILRSISDYSRIIRLPQHIHAKLSKISKAKQAMTDEIGRVPSEPELAHYLGMNVDKLRAYNSATRNVVSLERPVRINGGMKEDRRTIGDSIASDAPTPEEDALRQYLKDDIRIVVDTLPEPERKVLVLRFGLENGESMTIDATADHLNMTRDKVRTMEARALNKLRNPQRNYRLKDYVGVERSDHEEETTFTAATATQPPSTRTKTPKNVQPTPDAPSLSSDNLWFF